MTNDDSRAAGQQPAQPPIPFPQPAAPYSPPPYSTAPHAPAPPPYPTYPNSPPGAGDYVSANDGYSRGHIPYSRLGGLPYNGHLPYPGFPVVRPRKVTVAAVLAFVSAGLTILLNVLGASIATKIDLGLNTFDWIFTILSVALSGAYIWGGVAALSAKSGQILVVAAWGAIALVVVNFVYLFAEDLPIAGNSFTAIVLPILIITRLTHDWPRMWFEARGGKTF